MADTLFTLYLIVGISGFIYSSWEQSKKATRSFAQSSNTQRLNRLSVSLFLGVVGYPLAALVAGASLGVALGLLYVSFQSVAQVLGVY
jgi:hypothetical protein